MLGSHLILKGQITIKINYIHPRECDGIYNQTIIFRNKQESCVITLAVMKIAVEFTGTLQSSTCINHI